MLSNPIKSFLTRIDGRLQQRCSELSPSKRLTAIIALCIIFGSISLSITISSISGIWNHDGKQLKLEYGSIKRLELQLPDSLKLTERNKHEQIPSKRRTKASPDQ